MEEEQSRSDSDVGRGDLLGLVMFEFDGKDFWRHFLDTLDTKN